MRWVPAALTLAFMAGGLEQSQVVDAQVGRVGMIDDANAHRLTDVLAQVERYALQLLLVAGLDGTKHLTTRLIDDFDAGFGIGLAGDEERQLAVGHGKWAADQLTE